MNFKLRFYLEITLINLNLWLNLELKVSLYDANFWAIHQEYDYLTS